MYNVQNNVEFAYSVSNLVWRVKSEFPYLYPYPYAPVPIDELPLPLDAYSDTCDIWMNLSEHFPSISDPP
jgi:hypothetical protein